MVTAKTRSITRIAVSAALAGTVLLSGGAGVLAQDATPVAGGGADPSQCVTPSSPLRTGGAPAASASPVAEAEPEVVQVEDEAVIAEATAAIENLYACYNAGDGVSYVLLLTDSGIEANFGDVARDVLAAEISAISQDAQANDLEILDVVELDGQLAVEYQVTLGQQVWHLGDVLVEHEDAWVVDDTYYFNPATDLDATTAGVKLTDGDSGSVIEVTPNPIMNQPAVRFQLAVETGDWAYFALLQGEGAAEIETLDLANLPEGVTFIGEETGVSDYRVEVLFENLPEGDYVIYMESESGSTTAELTIDPPFDPNA